jgi:hypothetical protein
LPHGPAGGRKPEPYDAFLMIQEREGAARSSAIAVVVAAMLIVLVFFGWQYSIVLQRESEGSGFDEVISTGALLLIWLLFLPVVFAMANRWPLSTGRRLRHLQILTAVAVPFAAARAVMDHGIWLLAQGAESTPRDFCLTVFLLFHSELLVTAALIVLANYFRTRREVSARRVAEARLAGALTRARLRKLRADLDPHFLFNALNAVAALLDTDPPAAHRVMKELTELLRVSLATHDSAAVPLATELEFIERYLAIQRVRLGPFLSADISVSDERLASAEIPPLLLQPLVENSIVHGAGKRRVNARISVVVDRVGDDLRMQVRDNGPGFDPAVTSRDGSVGIPAARERLLYLYGSRHSFTFRRTAEDFVAEIRIPLRWHGAAS